MIDTERAIEIARARAKANGWGFGEPVDLIERRSWRGRPTRYEIVTNAAMRGTKARFTIDAETGEILEQGYIPR